MFIEQRQVGQMAVFAYLVGDEESGEALVIDPAADTDGIIAAAEKSKVRIKYIVNTHGHVDHIGGNVDIKTEDGRRNHHPRGGRRYARLHTGRDAQDVRRETVPARRSERYGTAISSRSAGSDSGSSTPPVIPRAASFFILDGYAFTGDTLFVEAVGRTDLPGGSGEVMFDSIQRKLCTLPDETVVLPGHNYGSTPTSTIGHEKKYNPFLTIIGDEGDMP